MGFEVTGVGFKTEITDCTDGSNGMEDIDGLEVGGARAMGNPCPGCTRSCSLVLVVVVVELDIEISEEFKSGTEINDLLESSSKVGGVIIGWEIESNDFSLELEFVAGMGGKGRFEIGGGGGLNPGGGGILTLLMA